MESALFAPVRLTDRPPAPPGQDRRAGSCRSLHETRSQLAYVRAEFRPLRQGDAQSVLHSPTNAAIVSPCMTLGTSGV
jgi:hypothetical protein